jgi:hypothetical protein
MISVENIFRRLVRTENSDNGQLLVTAKNNVQLPANFGSEE